MANEDSTSSVSAVHNSAISGGAAMSSAENSMVDGEQVYHVFRDFNQGNEPTNHHHYWPEIKELKYGWVYIFSN